MASENALQLVTATIAELLRDRMQRRDVVFSFGRPITANADNPIPRLNLYLYQVSENPNLRNEEDPARMVPGQFGTPPLVVTLSYLMTTYGNIPERKKIDDLPALSDDSLTELDSQVILADAMRVLHDIPVVTPKTESLQHPGQNLLDLGLQGEFENIRVTQKQLSLDELTKLWTAFKEDFQRSVAYEVSVIRIERPRPKNINPPVLQRTVQAMPRPYYGFRLSLSATSAATLDKITLSGDSLADPSYVLTITDVQDGEFPAAPTAVAKQFDAPTQTYFIQIPNDPANFQPGLKQLQAHITHPNGSPLFSNPVALQVLPRVTVINPHNGAFTAGGTPVVITGTSLGLAPALPPGQPPGRYVAQVLFGAYAVPAEQIDYTGLPGQLTATLISAPDVPQAGRKLSVRVRVNGIDSIAWRMNALTGEPEVDPAFVFTVL
jgi:hypothetical protein